MKFNLCILLIQYISILTIAHAQDFFPKPHIFNEKEIRKYKIKSVKRFQDGQSFFEEYNEKGFLLSSGSLDDDGNIFEKKENIYNNAGELIETIYYHKEQGENKNRTLFYTIGDTIYVKKQFYLEIQDDDLKRLRFITYKYNLRKKIIRREEGIDGGQEGNVIEYSYFPNDSLKEEIEYYTSNIEKGRNSDSVEINTIKRYNKYGKLLISKNPWRSTEYVYLNDTLPLKKVYMRFEDGFEQIKKWEYDKDNRLLKEYYIDVDNGEPLMTLSLKYNSKGDTIEKKIDTRLFKYEYINSIRKEFIYDILYSGNIVQEIWRDEEMRIIKSITYDKSVIIGVRTYKYDGKGRIIEEYFGQDNDVQLAKKYDYDKDGNTIYSGLYLNNKVRKEERRSFSNGKLQEEYNGTYGRDSLIEKHIYKYDEKLKLVRQERWDNNKLIFFYDFQYDVNDNIIKAIVTDYCKGQTPQITTYQYTYSKYSFLEEEKVLKNNGMTEIRKKITFEYY